jgi:hypothetical protein
MDASGVPLDEEDVERLVLGGTVSRCRASGPAARLHRAESVRNDRQGDPYLYVRLATSKSCSTSPGEIGRANRNP